MRENITAQWARETAENFLNEKATNQLEKVLDLIEHNVKDNFMSCNFYSELENMAIDDLKKRGFTVKFHSSFRDDDDYYNISW